MYVIKRDGRKVLFDADKIKQAVLNAFSQVDNSIITDDAVQMADNIASFVEKKNCTLSVEEIQDIVESKLMSSKRKDVAKEYVIYRNERTKIREQKSELMKKISEKINATNVQNQNANIDEKSFGGRMGEANDVVMKNYALNYCMSKKARDNHLNNEIYIHDLNSYAIGSHNCFNRNVKFLTDSGIKTFENFNDGDTTKVLCYDGVWREATIKYFGKQDMQKITFSRCGTTKEVVCTKNHRWLLSDGNFTDNIVVGDKLYPLKDITEYEPKTKREKEMFCFGFVIGDGCDFHNNYVQIRLCANKNTYSKYFEECNYHKRTLKNTDDVLYTKNINFSKQKFLSNKEWRLLSFEDKIALFNGYISADGSKTTNTKFVWTSDERVLEMINEISYLSGYHVFRIKKENNTTKYKENRTLYTITFTIKYSNNTLWKVDKIQRYSYNSSAWCVVEPITHTFTLNGGMVTGNCLSIPFDDLLAKGFNTRQTDVRPANSVNTAFQLVAVIFQLQSLQQFGKILCRG